MFRVAKIDAEKQRGVAEVLGVKAFPSVFGMKDGILLDNFVGILPQDEVNGIRRFPWTCFVFLVSYSRVVIR